MIKGGRWIANFDRSFRGFNISRALKKSKVLQKNDVDLFVYGGVKGKGFLLSRAFAFLASPTYIVGCAAIHIENTAKIKWSTLVDWVREITSFRSELELEWLWILFFGEGGLPEKVKKHLERFNQRDTALLYADLKNIQIVHSDSFIARRGEKLFHPKNLDRKGFSIKFWQKTNEV